MTLTFGEIVSDLHRQGYSVSEGLLPPTHIADLATIARSRQARGQLVRARTGKAKVENETLRGDSIDWLDEDSTEPAIVDCLATFDALCMALNEHLFLNVHEIESHLAIYPPGAVYQRHLDQFVTGPQVRRLSLVLYLNDRWLDSNGGALRLHLDDEVDDHIDIFPTAGRLVLFESSRFWHEVLPADRERISLTGWFRTRTSF